MREGTANEYWLEKKMKKVSVPCFQMSGGFRQSGSPLNDMSEAPIDPQH